MKYFIMILIVFCLLHVNVQTETTYDTDGGLTNSTTLTGTTPTDWYKNMEKYWYYRYRLVNDFKQNEIKTGKRITSKKINPSL